MNTPSSGPLSGQTALVTGGARGLGLACVRALSALGVQVTFTVRTPESRDKALTDLADTGARAVVCDITDRPGLAEVLSAGFDILVNNAAVVTPIGRITDLSTEDFAASLDTNVTAQFDAIRLALPAMLARGRGSIVNISSGAAHRPQEGWAAYCAGKAALAMLTKSVHHEYGAQGIRVFGLAPGTIDTGMQGQIRASGINPVSQMPRSALAPAEQPAQMVAWLCTAAADGLIGQELDVRTPALREAAGLPPLT
ncbi:SDR family NAD(P)-dependent oxidoreductase [Neotabrizicola sp. VNH66]|uniref:SDR family NAD(P)-dependent oxidoreductase n=1 Tax=Neotabrizicola sp. VNH66 TaxID=3400918 RepID=UPI003C0091C4